MVISLAHTFPHSTYEKLHSSTLNDLDMCDSDDDLQQAIENSLNDVDQHTNNMDNNRSSLMYVEQIHRFILVFFRHKVPLKGKNL